MSRERMDIMVELLELSREVVGEIKHQLNYYRASVYKHETAQQIKDKIEQLRMLAEVINDELVMEPFMDYEATVDNGNVRTLPGECFFSTRVSALLNSFSDHLEGFESQLVAGAGNPQADTKDLTRNLQKNRHKILKMCRQGTRQWDFFRSL